MMSIYLKGLLATVAVSAFCPNNVCAQVSSQNPNATGANEKDRPPTSRPLPSADNGTAFGDAGDIVVTAQKRTENVQDIPKAVQVVSQAALTRAGVTSLADLGRISPSIQGTSAGPFAPPAIRGISSFALSIGVQTQTGIVLDDIPQPSFSTLASELTDVERVEVLPGPQSTLSGRNAAGGLINIVTHNPTQTFTGNFLGEQTGDRQTRIGGYISGPLTTNLGFSLSGFWDKWDGPIRNAGEGGKRLGGFNQRGIRGKLQWHLSDRLTVLATGYYTNGHFLQTPLLQGSPYIVAAPGVGSLFAPGTFQQTFPRSPIGPYNTVIDAPGHSVSDNKNAGGSFRIDYETDVGMISSISSYFKGSQPRTDLVIAFPIGGSLSFAKTDTKVTYKTEELRIASPSSKSRLTYLAGVIYTDTNNVEPYDRNVLFPVNWDRSAYVRSVALYGRATYEIVKDTSLTVGLRYQHDKQGYSFVFADGTAPTSRNSSKYGFVAGEVSLQHNFSQDIKGYLTYANAQTGRAYDLENNKDAATPAGLLPIPSEKVQNYEAGLKTQWFDRKLTFNVSIFNANYKNYQVQSTQQATSANEVPVIRLFAIGKVRNRGVEVSANYAVTSNLRLGVDGSYLDAKILSYPGATCYLGQTVALGCLNGVQDRHGTLPGTSKIRFTSSVNYVLPLPELPFDGTFGAFYRFQGRTNYDLFGNPIATQKEFGILNLTAGLKEREGRLSIEVFVNNVTNKRYYASVNPDNLATGVAATAAYARDSSRYAGARINYHF